MTHSVYFLFDAETGKLLYVGRSKNPIGRKSAFERRTGRQTVFGFNLRYQELGQACDAELKAIKDYRPPFNKYVASSPCRLGLKNSPQHNQAISAALTGLKRTAATRAKLSLISKQRKRGKDSAETKALKSAARKRRWITYQGLTLCLDDWALRTGILRGTIAYRINSGWPIAKALQHKTLN